MSLHHLAQQVQSKGRGEDTQLIHMTPKEVQGLQALAMKHGGSLTINPQTGLPEAGFLSSILPMIAGLALAPLTAGTSLAFLGATPFATALTVGGATGLATGSLKKGLMAGLGAFGGAGLGASLAGAGAAGAAAAPTIAPGVVNGVGTAGVASGVNPLIGNMASGAGTAGVASGFNAAAPFANVPAAVANATAPAQLTAANQALQIAPAQTFANMGQGLQSLNSLDALKTFGGQNMMNIGMAGAPVLNEMMQPGKLNAPKTDQGMIRPYTLSRTQNPQAYAQDTQGRTNTPVYGSPFDSSERTHFTDQYTAGTPYAAPGPEYKAATGGLTALAVGGPVEEMSAQNALGQNTGYPMANLQSSMYANPQVQRPMSSNVVSASGDASVDPYTGEQKFAAGGMTEGHLGSYSDGGRLLKGPGDGVSDSIPASIGNNQPARLADGEFVVPARIVSELGNGSTEAGARQLYKMMERVQRNRRKSVGKNKVAVDAKSAKFLPA